MQNDRSAINGECFLDLYCWRELNRGERQALRRGLERLDISKLDYFKSKVLQMFSDHTKPGFVLGRKFVLARPEEDAAFKEYWQSLLWFSYRSDFPPIEPTTCTSDVGWGCTLRTAQMLLANAFLHHYVGHDWISKSSLQSILESRLKIVKWFSDNSTSPYSIHSIALGGVRYNKQVGDWHGPNTVSYVIRDLVEAHCPDNNSIGIYISSDGVVYRDKLFQAPHRAQIILVPLRLGVHIFNKAYSPSVQMLFSIPQFLGIIGGRPSSSYFFVGHHEENLFYLDPHTNQAYVDFTPAAPEDLVKDSVKSSMLSLLETYQPSNIGRMPMSQIDPSLTLGFYCHDAQDFALLEESVLTLLPHSRELPALFTFADVTPNYEEAGSSTDIISFAEDDF